MIYLGDDNSIPNDDLSCFSDGFSRIFKENYFGEFHDLKLSFADEIEINENFKCQDPESFQYSKEVDYFFSRIILDLTNFVGHSDPSESYKFTLDRMKTLYKAINNCCFRLPKLNFKILNEFFLRH